MNLCSTPESAKWSAKAVADHAPSAFALPGSSSAHQNDVNQTSRSSAERPPSRAPASSSSSEEPTASGEMPRPMTTPSAILPASRSEREAWAPMMIGMRRGPAHGSVSAWPFHVALPVSSRPRTARMYASSSASFAVSIPRCHTPVPPAPMPM